MFFAPTIWVTASKSTSSGICVFNGMWTHQVWSIHNGPHVCLNCCLGGNWVIWIISYSRWAPLGFVVVTRLSRPCTLIYEWCIKRSNQDIQCAETKKALCLHMDITLHLMNGNRPRWSVCAWCQTLDRIWKAHLRMKQEMFINTDERGTTWKWSA